MGASADKLPLADLRKRYVDEGRALPQEIESALKEDPRAGAKAILAAVEKRRFANRAEGQRLQCLASVALLGHGFSFVGLGSVGHPGFGAQQQWVAADAVTQ